MVAMRSNFSTLVKPDLRKFNFPKSKNLSVHSSRPHLVKIKSILKGIKI